MTRVDPHCCAPSTPPILVGDVCSTPPHNQTYAAGVRPPSAPCASRLAASALIYGMP
jgi:hypothetical protein